MWTDSSTAFGSSWVELCPWEPEHGRRGRGESKYRVRSWIVSLYCELCQDVEKLFVANLCGWLLSAKESRTAKARLLLMYWRDLGSQKCRATRCRQKSSYRTFEEFFFFSFFRLHLFSSLYLLWQSWGVIIWGSRVVRHGNSPWLSASDGA